MSRILDFFQRELNNYNENKAKVEDEIHRIYLDIEFLRKARNEMIEQSDKTFDIFYVNNNAGAYVNSEIEILNQKENSLLAALELKKGELENLNCKIEEYEDLYRECLNQRQDEELKSKKNTDTTICMQETERQQIARDIHDSVVQKLTVLIHKSEFAMKIIDSDTVRVKLELQIINNIIRQCINDLREIILNLRPMSLDDLGFQVTLNRAIAQINNDTEMDINLNYHNIDDAKVGGDIAVNILRIIQELCSNAIKYSNGKMVNIDISGEEDKLIITFEDDGTGLPEGKVEGEHINSGFGIPFLKERIKLLNGSMRIGKNRNNIGLGYYIEIPFKNEEK